MYSKNTGHRILLKADGSIEVTAKTGKDILLGGSGGTPVMLNTIITKFNTHTHAYVAPSGPAVTAVPTPLLVLATDSALHVKAKATPT